MAKAVYQIIKDQILIDIDGETANSPIESERELALKYKASRMTVRRAVNDLVEEGYLYRDKNKGTFVANQKLHKKNTSQELLSKSQSENFKILYFNVKEADRDIANRLEIDVNDLILRVVRVNYNEGKPKNVEELYFIRNDIKDNEINNLDFLKDMNNYIETGSITQSFVAMNVPVQYANLLHIKINTPIIVVDSLISRKNGKPLLRVKTYNNPNETLIEITS